MERIRSAYTDWVELPQPKKAKALRAVSLVSFFLFLFILVVYIFSETRHASQEIPKVVIFMDAMPYNLEVIRYYAQRRDVEISMIVLTLDGWVGNLNAAFESVAAFLKLLYNEGYSKRIPLYYGNSLAGADLDFFQTYSPSSALSSNVSACTYRRFLPDALALNAETMFGVTAYLQQVDIGDMAMQPSFFESPLRALLEKNAVGFLVLGACTDAAWFLQTNEAHRRMVTSIVVAGGNFLGPGDVSQVIMRNASVEMSFFFDPQAADYLMRGAHGRPVTLIPLDATIPWKTAAYDAIIGDNVGDTSGSSAGIVAKALYGYYSLLESHTPQVLLPVIAAAFMADAYLQNYARGLVIPVHVAHGNATTIGGLSFRPRSGSFDVKVVTELDAERFFEHLINVNSLPLA